MSEYGNHAISVSYEFFPSRINAGQGNPLAETVEAIGESNPWLVSVTHHPGGPNSQSTSEAVEWLKNNQDAPVMPHLVCAAQSRQGLVELIDGYHQQGVKHVLAVAGDEPKNPAERGELRYASELVA